MWSFASKAFLNYRHANYEMVKHCVSQTAFLKRQVAKYRMTTFLISQAGHVQSAHLPNISFIVSVYIHAYLQCFSCSTFKYHRVQVCNIDNTCRSGKYCKTSLDISLGNFELAVSEHNKFYNSKEQIRGRYLNEMLDLMEKIERDMRAVDIIAEKISKLHE